MATIYSVIKRMGGLIARSASNLMPVSPAPGAMSPVIAEVNLAAAQVADVINICTIQAPASYRVREMNHAALGAASTLKIGRAGATAEQMTAQDTSVAAVRRADAGFWRDISADEDVIATLAGGAATGRVQFEIDVVQGCRAAYQP